MTRTRSSFRRLAALLAFALTLACLLPARLAHAVTPAVVYDGSTQTISGENLAGGNLFANFTEVMPGDDLAQGFDIRATRLARPVSVYLRSNYSAEALALLGELEFTITVDGAEVASGTMASHAALAQGVRVATFSADGTAHVEVTIHVPTSLGNETQGMEALVDWLVVVQEDGGSSADGSSDSGSSTGNSSGSAPSEPVATAPTKALPQTGDTTNYAPIIALGATAVALVILGLVLRSRKR